MSFERVARCDLCRSRCEEYAYSGWLHHAPSDRCMLCRPCWTALRDAIAGAMSSRLGGENVARIGGGFFTVAGWRATSFEDVARKGEGDR